MWFGCSLDTVKMRSTWVHLGPLGSTWVYLGLLGSTWVYLGPLGSTWVYLVHLSLFQITIEWFRTLRAISGSGWVGRLSPVASLLRAPYGANKQWYTTRWKQYHSFHKRYVFFGPRGINGRLTCQTSFNHPSFILARDLHTPQPFSIVSTKKWLVSPHFLYFL